MLAPEVIQGASSVCQNGHLCEVGFGPDLWTSVVDVGVNRSNIVKVYQPISIGIPGQPIGARCTEVSQDRADIIEINYPINIGVPRFGYS